MNKIIVITGPTGVGKTKLSIEIAKYYDGEIINCDAVQIYKGLDIGSAKVSEDEMDGVVHHLLSIKDVNEDYSIYDYQKDSRKIINDIIDRGKTPIMVGGTGLYIKSSLYDYTLEDNDNVINCQYEDMSTEELYQELIKLDKDIIIDRYNRVRIIRAINYYKTFNKSIMSNKNGNVLLYDAIFIGLTTERENLYNIINNRVDKMIDCGLVQEVKSFYDKGINSKIFNRAIGYKELYSYFRNEISLDEAIDLIKRNSRRYAKRQYTFFNHQLNIKWFSTDYNNFNNTINDVIKYIDNCK